jgi:hypothetical protein
LRAGVHGGRHRRGGRSVRIAGAAAFVEEALAEDARALVY